MGKITIAWRRLLSHA